MRYRNSSPEVFSVIASLLPDAPFERASNDEAFVDITAHVEPRLSSPSPPAPAALPEDTHVLGACGAACADDRVRMLREGARADVLYRALLRPGRLDRHIMVYLPDFVFDEKKSLLK